MVFFSTLFLLLKKINIDILSFLYEIKYLNLKNSLSNAPFYKCITFFFFKHSLIFSFRKWLLVPFAPLPFNTLWKSRAVLYIPSVHWKQRLLIDCLSKTICSPRVMQTLLNYTALCLYLIRASWTNSICKIMLNYFPLLLHMNKQ